ncbi:MAG: DUF4105 domain-containing protein [Pirellulales bacterium]
MSRVSMINHFQRLQTAVLFLAILMCQGGCGLFTRNTASKSKSEGRVARGINAVLASARLPARAKPSHDRIWKPNISVLPFAEIRSDQVHLHNIRDTHYRTEDDCDVRHFDQVVRLDDIQSLDFVVIPFKSTPSLAHTMISFGLANGQHIVFSVEARLEQGESYAPWEGSLNSYELIWIVATERDSIGLRTTIRGDDVYLYRTRALPEQARQVFLAATARVNEIERTPEFYDTLTNNCTTNIINMVNRLKPGTIQEDIRVLLPGHSDKLLYDQGLLVASGPFDQLKQASRINLAANLNFGSPNFSQAIRGDVAP